VSARDRVQISKKEHRVLVVGEQAQVRTDGEDQEQLPVAGQRSRVRGMEQRAMAQLKVMEA